MANLLKSDLYRLFRSKCFYISLVLVATMIVLYLSFDIKNNSQHNIFSLIDKICKNYSISIPMVFFMALYAGQEFSFGVIKCFLAKGISRTQFFLAKSIICSLAISIFVLLGFLVGIVIGQIHWNIFEGITANSIKLVLFQYLMQTELHIAYGMLMLLVIYILGKMQISTMVNTGLLIFGFAILKSLQSMLNLRWNLYNFWIGSLIDICQTNNSYTWRVFEIFMGAAYIIVCLCLGFLIFGKRNLK